MGRLDGKRAVITGGASGIGEATARLFVAEGATVVLADTDELRGKRIAGELGDAARFVATDVSHEADVEQAVATSLEVFGGLDVMFNNAGVPGSTGGIEEIDVETWDRTAIAVDGGLLTGSLRRNAPMARGEVLELIRQSARQSPVQAAGERR